MFCLIFILGTVGLFIVYLVPLYLFLIFVRFLCIHLSSYISVHVIMCFFS